MKLYGQSKYVIFPSLFESFGLPLIEGIASGCKIIAADLSYTYAVIRPSFTFNPFEVDEIKKAVIFAINNELPDSKILIKNEIELLINSLS